jgi:threonine dehydrogenase-like Zn-dependent dehydrogenase
VIDPAAADPSHEILRDTSNRGVDIAIDCASKGDSTNQCIQAVRHAGRVVVTGIPSEDYIRLAFHIMRRKELAFYSVRRSNHDSETALRLLAGHSRRFAPIFTHQRPLADIQAAFELCETYSDGVGKLTITL